MALGAITDLAWPWWCIKCSAGLAHLQHLVLAATSSLRTFRCLTPCSRLCMFSAFLLFLFLVLIIGSEDLDSRFGLQYDFGSYKALATPSKSSRPIELASSSHWGSDFEFCTAEQIGSDSFPTSFSRRRSHQGHLQSHEVIQYSVEVYLLQTTPQAQCDPLSHLPFAVADSHGQNLCARSETEPTELGYSNLWSLWSVLLPGTANTPPENTEPEAESAESTWSEFSPHQGRWQGLRSVQLCPVPAVPARTYSTTSSSDGATFASTCDTSSMDAIYAADAQHDAYAHATAADGMPGCDASALPVDGYAGTYPATQHTGSSSEGLDCLSTEEIRRSPSRHSAESPQHLQERRQEAHQGPGIGGKGPGRSSHSIRGGSAGTFPAYQYMESFLSRSCQELVGLWQTLRTARGSFAIKDSCGQGAIPGRQGVHGGFTGLCWQSGGARTQRRGRPAWGRRSQRDANHREHPVAVHLAAAALQGDRIDPDRGECGQKTQIGPFQKRGRRGSAFQLGWLWTTLWCLNRQPDVLDLPEVQTLKWSHSIMKEPTFLCEFGARERAHQLALEVALDHPQIPSRGAFALCSSRLSKPSSHVGFADWTDLHIWFEDDSQSLQLSLPEEFFDGKLTPWSGCPKVANMRRSRFQVCPWHEGLPVRSCRQPTFEDDIGPMKPNDFILQCKITDNHLDNPARRYQQQHPEVPDPDEIPDIQEAPRFAQDLQALADMHQAFSNPDGEGILRLRTWYIHHSDQQTNFHSRTVELDEDWRRWETDIIGAWRTHLQADTSIFLHLAAPDPYRGYLNRETHGDIIITQGNEQPRRAGLVTVHYHGGEVDPHSYAVACSLELVVSGFRFAEVADAGQWCHLPQNRCAVTYGWQTIPFDHLPRHEMHSGDAITITITRTIRDDRAGHHTARIWDDQPLREPQPADGPAHDDVADYDFLPEPHPLHEDSSTSEQAEEEVGVHVYCHEKPEAHCYIQWDTYRRILLDIVRCLRLPRDDIIGMHFVQALPVGVHPVFGRAVILQATGDVPAGSGEQLILLDQEIHFHALPSGLLVPPAFSRKVLRIFPPIHRSQLLHRIGLRDYCELHGDRCTAYENNVLWPAQDRTVHPLTHGAYVRIIVPPPDDPTLDTEIAIAITRDFTTEVQEPSADVHITECSDRSQRPGGEGDSSAFFQHALHRFQRQCDTTLCALAPSQWKVAPEHVSGPQLPVSNVGVANPLQNPRPLSRFHGRDFDTLSNLFNAKALIECEEEGPIAYVDTWYIDHARLPTCEVPRAVKLFQDPTEWLADLLRPWDDTIDINNDILIFIW